MEYIQGVYIIVFNIMCLVYSDIPVKCLFHATKYGNIIVDLK